VSFHRSCYLPTRKHQNYLELYFFFSICTVGTVRSIEVCSRASLVTSGNSLKYHVVVDVVNFFTDGPVNVNQYTNCINKASHDLLNA